MHGNDLCFFDGVRDISSKQLKSLVLLYSEISSRDDIDFYLKMVFYEKNSFKRISDVMTFFNISPSEFERRLHNLEKVELARTYNRDNEYIFVLLNPLEFKDFFAHPIYGRLLMKKVNREHFYELKGMCEEVSFDYRKYQDISEKPLFSELSDWDQEKEKDYRITSSVKELTRIDSYFDISHFMKNISSALFPVELRTNDNLNTIAKLADAYGVSESDMRKYLKDAISINPLNFDEKKLNSLCKNTKGITGDNDNGYKMPCAAFLTKLQSGRALVPHDLNIIDQLINKYYLNPEVVNVLLEYAMKRCDNQLIPNFIYAIAANFNRKGIKTSDEALKALTAKKTEKSSERKEELPVYDSANNISVSTEDISRYLGG